MKPVILVLLGMSLLIIQTSCVTSAQSEPRRIKVMIIDTGISPLSVFQPYLSTQGTKNDLNDTHGHGTHITGLVLFGKGLKDPVCNEVQIYSCKFYGIGGQSIENCVRKASKLNVDFINISGGGRGYSPGEASAVKAFKGKMIAAIGNEEVIDGKVVKPAWDASKEGYYPASLRFENIIIVGNGKDEANRYPSSNYGIKGMIWRDGVDVISYNPDGGYRAVTGSSQATAIYTHELIQAKCQRLRSAK
jgi:subtilisin family serine protease